MSVKRKIVPDQGWSFDSGSEVSRKNIHALSFDDVISRNDDIDQLTAEYIMGLLGDNCDLELEDVGIDDPHTLEAIEDEIERVLADFGIFIYRPVVVEENGVEVIWPSAYSKF